MKGLRQSMAGLHTWTGLLAGWILYFVFLTGTAGYFTTAIDYWMRPEVSPSAASLSAAEAAEIGRQRLEALAPEADRWIIYPPSGHDIPNLTLSWLGQPASAGAPSGTRVLHPATAEPIEARETGGGQTLYRMHYLLRYLSPLTAYWIVGVCSMFMLVALLSGVITHKRIFRDLFTFRSHKGERSWLDVHNAVGVTALPFHLMITYSGLVFFAVTYMPLIVAATYGAGAEGRAQFFEDAYARHVQVERSGVDAPLASFAPMLAAAESHWGAGQVRSIDVRLPGDANALVTLQRGHVTPSSHGEQMVFDGVSGALHEPSLERSGPMSVNQTLMNLHEGIFAGTFLRWLYFLSGLLGTAMIATGLVLWTAKRRARQEKAAPAARLGLIVVERLNAGVIVGLPIGVAAYFWANRVIPADLVGRSEWEAHALFLAWSGALLVASLRPLRRIWVELLCIAAAAWTLLPVLNAMTTNAHLGVTLAERQWMLAGFDLTVLVFGAAFALGAFVLARGAAQAAPQPVRQRARAEQATAPMEEAS